MSGAIYFAKQGEEASARALPGRGAALARLLRALRDSEPGTPFVVWRGTPRPVQPDDGYRPGQDPKPRPKR
jgi:hypothetical protein